MCNADAGAGTGAGGGAAVYPHHHQNQPFLPADVNPYCTGNNVNPENNHSAVSSNCGPINSSAYGGLAGPGGANATGGATGNASSDPRSTGSADLSGIKYEHQNSSPSSVVPSHSPSGIVSDNGLQYANLDGSSAAAVAAAAVGYGPPTSYHHHSHAAAAASLGGYSQYHSDHGGGGGAALGPDAGLSLPAATAASFSAYLDNPNQAVPYASTGHASYPSLYHQPKIRKSPHHDYPSYPHVPKAANSVPTYKWMQVKRNVPKPGKIFMSYYHLVASNN